MSAYSPLHVVTPTFASTTNRRLASTNLRHETSFWLFIRRRLLTGELPPQPRTEAAVQRFLTPGRLRLLPRSIGVMTPATVPGWQKRRACRGTALCPTRCGSAILDRLFESRAAPSRVAGCQSLRWCDVSDFKRAFNRPVAAPQRRKDTDSATFVTLARTGISSRATSAPTPCTRRPRSARPWSHAIRSVKPATGHDRPG